MAIALVKAGTAVTTTTVVTLSPTFGQPTTAGNLLIATVCWTEPGGSVGMGTTAPGWIGLDPDQSFGYSYIFYKPNCGTNETPPTFTNGQGVTIGAAWLSEWSGAATGQPALDQHSAKLSNTQTNPLYDASAGDLVVVVMGWAANSKNATYTFSRTWNPTGGTLTNFNTGTTKSTNTIDINLYLIAGNGGVSADSLTETVTPSTGSGPSPAGAIASFKPAGVGGTELALQRRPNDVWRPARTWASIR